MDTHLLNQAVTMKILLIESDDALKQTLSMVLQADGHRVVPCDGSPHQLAQYLDQTFDALLANFFDFGWGDAAYPNWLGEAHFCPQKVVYSTFPDDATRARSEGATCFLRQPFTVEELRKAIREPALIPSDLEQPLLSNRFPSRLDGNVSYDRSLTNKKRRGTSHISSQRPYRVSRDTE